MKRNTIKINRAFIVIVASLLLSLLMPATVASAQPGTGTPPASISGRFHLDDGFYTNSSMVNVRFPGTLTVDGYDIVSYGSNGDGNDRSFSCISPGAANWGDRGQRDNRDGTVYASFYSNWEIPGGGISWYWVDAIIPDKEPAPPGRTQGVQYLGGGWIGIAWEFERGTVNLEKSSASPSITDGNPCYSLEGAVYDVYDSGGTWTGSITTDAQGKGSLGNLELGTYNVKETTAPPGYNLDPQTYTVTASSGSSMQTVYSTDQPNGDPFLVMLQKIDAETGGTYGAGNLPQAAASLAKAEYTVKYYTGLYSSVEQANAATPMRTWTIGTLPDGYASLGSVIGGDPLFYSITGAPIIPFGTITIVETKAPAGYLLPKPGDANYKVFLTRYVPDTSQPYGVRIEGDGNGVVQGNEPKHADKVIRGDFELTKYYWAHEPNSTKKTGARIPEPNATFDFYVSRDFSGTTPKSSARPAFSLTTDTRGLASTVKSDIYLIQNPDGTNKVTARPAGAPGGLPYDSYLCIQRTTDPAYEKCKPFVFTIGTQGQRVAQDVYDDIVAAFVQIEKRDAETGKVVAYPATWQIYSEQTNSYVEMTVSGRLTDRFTSNATGELTLPESLPYGDYLLHEVEAPSGSRIGYILNSVDIPFSVTKRYERGDPLVVTMKDMSAQAIIEINKEGARTEKPVQGAEYIVIADGDIVTLDGTVRATDGETVATLMTGADGKAASKPLYLGNYIVKESIAPDGYLLDTKEYKVSLVYRDQLTPVFTERLGLTDTEVFLEVAKLDKSTDEPIPDTEFTLYRESAPGSGSWSVAGTFVTDTRGKLVFFPILKGSYKLVETRPNPQYASNGESGEDEARYFTIDEYSTEEIQVFHDERIRISCETFKDTINITSAGFRTFDEDHVRIENVGSERYHYTLDFRSTSNVRADEFTVVDPLFEVLTGKVRVVELFTPVAEGDTDGLFNLWYQTNLTDKTQVYSSANAMSTNPDNPNNPKNAQNWPSTGWRLWQRDISTTDTVRLSVADLDLAAGEYITALRYEYGSVEVGFTTRNTVRQALQQTKELKSTKSDWSENPQAADGQFVPAAVTELAPAVYLVDCSSALLPPALIEGSASVYIARNVVLNDDDRDTVKTTVIEPFMVPTDYTPPTDITTLEGYETPLPGGLPPTGDLVVALFISIVVALALPALVAMFRYRRNSRLRRG